MTNFSFISAEWRPLQQTLVDAEQQVFAAPGYTAVLCRKSLEEWVRWLYENDVDLELPDYDTSLNSLMYEQAFKDLLAPSLFKQANLVRKLGNDAVHTNLKVKPGDALHVLKIMHGLAGWVIRLYSGTKVVVPSLMRLLYQQSPTLPNRKKNLKR